MTAAGEISVLVVEDAPEFRIIAEAAIGGEGWTVSHAQDGETALEMIEADQPTLVVLDIGLPGIDGIEVCRQLRTFTDVYVIMLTAKDDELDRLVGLAVGADDYICKPFSPRELVARIKAMHRRPRQGYPPTPDDLTREVVGDLTIDRVAREVTLAGEEVTLTKIEFDLLTTLTGRPKMVFTREMLLEQVWDTNWLGDGHVVDVHIANLRRKIDIDSRNHIKTVRGVGYRLATG